MIITTSYALEPIFFVLKRLYREHTFLEWTADETLQLQRAAYQGIGSGDWVGYTDAVPTTQGTETLADLAHSYKDAPSGEQMACRFEQYPDAEWARRQKQHGATCGWPRELGRAC